MAAALHHTPDIFFRLHLEAGTNCLLKAGEWKKTIVQPSNEKERGFPQSPPSSLISPASCPNVVSFPWEQGPTFHKLGVDEFLCQVDPSLSLELVTAVWWQVFHPQGGHEELLVCVCQSFWLAGQHSPALASVLVTLNTSNAFLHRPFAHAVPSAEHPSHLLPHPFLLFISMQPILGRLH